MSDATKAPTPPGACSGAVDFSVPHLLHVFSTFAVGGPQRRLAAVANHVAERYRHTIIALDGCYSCKAHLDSDAHTAFLRFPGQRRGFIANGLRFRSVVRAERPGLLLTYNWGAIEWALANRLRPACPHLHFEDGFGPEEVKAPLLRRSLARRVALSGKSLVVVPSQTLRKIALGVWKLDPAKVKYIPNGIDVDRFAKALPDPSIVQRFAPRDRTAIVGTVATLRPEKNISRLIRSFASVVTGFNAKLVVAGGGPELDRLKDLARSHCPDGSVIFLGPIDRPERLLPLFDVFALSSDTEQMPLTVLEAMAAGCAIAAMDVGDVRAMLPCESHPFIADSGDTAGLGSVIGQLLSRPELRARLGAANQTHVRTNFAAAEMFAAYDRLYSLALYGGHALTAKPPGP